MASTQTFNVIQASLVTNTTVNPATQALVIVYQPQPTVVGGNNVTSPYTGQFTITSPTTAQINKYTATGATIGLTTDT